MAYIQKFTADEAASIDAAAVWNPKAELTSSVSTEGNFLVSGDTHTLMIQTPTDLYIAFSADATDTIDSSDDLYLTGGDGIHNVRVPYGVGDTIYFHYKARTAGGNVRIVEG